VDETAGNRDFPKTLTLDEPGIDDEMSFPTYVRVNGPAIDGRDDLVQNDTAFEIDKRITTSLEMQINGGYTVLNGPARNSRHGWDDLSLTAKYVLLDHPATETILTFAALHVFGRTGALQAGADPGGSTTPILYVGQGLGATRLPDWARAFAVTTGFSYTMPDRARAGTSERAVPYMQAGGSLQYAFSYLAPALAKAGLPTFATHMVGIIELTYDATMRANTDANPRHGLAAPGLIYAGGGYQLAAEALLPITRASGRGVGFIAQLNMSFEKLGLGAIARPLW
jgi:hypothetical protein